MECKTQLIPRLVIIDGKEKGRVITLNAGTQILGRSKSDIVLSDVRISRAHVSISVDLASGSVCFSDLNSLNGTLVNGQSKPSGALKDGDQIQLGDTIFDLQILKVAPEITAQKHLAEMLSIPPPGNTPDIEPPSAAATDDEFTMHFKPPTAWYKRWRVIRRVTLALVTVLIVTFALSLKTRPSLHEFQNRLAGINHLVSSERLDEALADSIRLSENFPQRPEPLVIAADIYRRHDKMELAIAAFRKAHEIPLAPPIIHVRLLRLYAMVQAKEGIEIETQHLDRLISEGPHDRDTFVELAYTLLELREKLGEPIEKAYILAKALQREIAPKDPAGFKLEADILIEQQKYLEALEPLRRIMDLSPQDEWPFEKIIFAAIRLGEPQTAVAAAMEWSQRHPNSPRPLLVMAYLKLSGGGTLDALPYAQRVIELKDKVSAQYRAEALAVAGNIYTTLGQTSEAESSLAESCNLGFKPACEKAGTQTNGLRDASSEDPTPPASKANLQPAKQAPPIPPSQSNE